MTGHGQAEIQTERVTVNAEVRAVNNRFLKINLNWIDGLAVLESRVNALVRKFIRRGTVNINLRIEWQSDQDHYRINRPVLESYLDQLTGFGANGGAPPVESLLQLPGVIEESAPLDHNLDELWPQVESALTSALDQLVDMRRQEGATMSVDLMRHCGEIQSHLADIAQLAPTVVDEYRRKLVERISQLLEPYNTPVEPSDVVREVGLFADRADISEELVRLRSHLEQFQQVIENPSSDGRKLDFLTQEMLREANTVGSKSNHAEISRLVVEIKTAIERIREMTQNVE